MELDNLLEIMNRLLGEDGCPWDKEQTHETLREYLLEECYETIDAINTGDMTSLKEELGDVLLQVVFHAKLAEKSGTFTMDDIIAAISHKLVSRHTHIFGDEKVKSAEDVIDVWEANKQKEKKQTPAEAMEAVPKALPALVRAAKVLKRAPAKKPSKVDALKELKSLIAGLEAAETDHFQIYGKILLKMVSLAAILGINAEISLTNAVEEFIYTNSAESP
ncbi:MAG: MazG family protein [Defluviitaleaceae bacterium]|nr:MazG family protein [Defluviitaleaceae bacterium]